MATLTVENYVKAIYQICTEEKKDFAATGEVAKRLGVSPGSVTSMMRTLSDSGLADYKAYEGVHLSTTGRRLALRILRRHRLVELFLVRTLGLTWDEVHEEAESLEHAVSDQLVDRIDEYLEFPERDPHGDPIPQADGSFVSSDFDRLDSCPEQTQFVLERVLHQTPEFLRYLSDSGLSVGTEAIVLENHPSAGALVVSTGEHRVTLGRDVAGSVLVRTI